MINECTDLIHKHERIVYHETGPKIPDFLDIICVLSDKRIKEPAHIIDMNAFRYDH